MRIRKRLPALAAALAALLPLCACGPAPGAAGGGAAGGPGGPAKSRTGADSRPAADPRLGPALAALEAATLAPEARERIRARVLAAPGPFLDGLDAVLAARAADPSLFLSADKEKRLPSDFVPEGLEGRCLFIFVAQKYLLLNFFKMRLYILLLRFKYFLYIFL